MRLILLVLLLSGLYGNGRPLPPTAEAWMCCKAKRARTLRETKMREYYPGGAILLILLTCRGIGQEKGFA